MNTCPKGHASESDDYCDECGSPMGSSHSGIKKPTEASENKCPDCQTPRESGYRFCEVCQYDFNIGQSAVSDSRLAKSDELARQALSRNDMPSVSVAEIQVITPATNVQQPVAEKTFEIPLLCRVTADPSFCQEVESKALFPSAGIDPLIFHLDLDENLIGRDSVSKNSIPDIPVNDPGISRRHLKIIKMNGVFCVLELGSANGTMLDGLPLTAGKPEPLKPGSLLRLGMWTQIAIEAR